MSIDHESRGDFLWGNFIEGLKEKKPEAIKMIRDTIEPPLNHLEGYSTSDCPKETTTPPIYNRIMLDAYKFFRKKLTTEGLAPESPESQRYQWNLAKDLVRTFRHMESNLHFLLSEKEVGQAKEFMEFMETEGFYRTQLKI
jgi:hypothetical protein